MGKYCYDEGQKKAVIEEFTQLAGPLDFRLATADCARMGTLLLYVLGYLRPRR